MASPAVSLISAAGCLLAALQTANAQSINANGMLLAQNNAAIEQSRLYRDATPPSVLGRDANGAAIVETESSTSDDDSFGAQQILKTQERARPWSISGGISTIFTDNVALTRRDAQDDVFFVASAAGGWSSRIGPELEANLGLHASLFRYVDNTALDFESLGFGAGLAWSPARARGVSFFARYDFTELLDSDGDHILMDHVLTLGAQKVFVFGRSHSLLLGATATGGLSDPSDAQRSVLGAFLSYRLQLTRQLETDFLIRPALHVYTDRSRLDYNQVFSWNLRYRLSPWADLNAFFSYGLNRSDVAAFDYNALTTGGGVGVNIRF